MHLLHTPDMVLFPSDRCSDVERRQWRSLIPPFLFDTLHARRVSLDVVFEFDKKQVNILVMEAKVAFNAVNERLLTHLARLADVATQSNALTLAVAWS